VTGVAIAELAIKILQANRERLTKKSKGRALRLLFALTDIANYKLIHKPFSVKLLFLKNFLIM